MTAEKLKAIKDKIAKLLAKAEKTDNVHEAEAFMAAVNRLLEEHQIEMFEIRAHNHNGDTDPMGNQEGEFNVYASMTWAKLVLHLVAKYYGASIIWEGRRKNHMPYRIFGRESARVTAELMIPYVVSQVRQQARLYAADHGMTQSVAQRNVGRALSARIDRMLHEVEQHRAELQSKALVPVSDVKAAVDDYYGGTVTKSRSSKKGYARSASDYADKISLHRQATGVGRKQIAGS